MDQDAFRVFVDEHGASLLHAARLLTGDHHRGEDLAQTVLIRVYRRWDRIDAPLAYARAALVTAHIDSTRRRWWGERPTDRLPEPPDERIPTSDDHDQLRHLLAGLSPRDRAIVVLRYYLDLSEQDTAAALGLPVGTVKSGCHRALRQLRVTAATREEAS